MEKAILCCLAFMALVAAIIEMKGSGIAGTVKYIKFNVYCAKVNNHEYI